MKNEERLALLYRVARRFYQDGKKKYEIAHEIGQSPSQVANLLDEAKSEGIVEIEVKLPRLKFLEGELKKRFRLADAIVVPYQSDCPLLLKQLAQAAAEYFDANVKGNSKVAVGGGYLTYEMASLLEDRRRDIDILPAALIGRGPFIAHIDPIIVATVLWMRSGRIPGHLQYMTVTPPDQPLSLSALQEYLEELRQREKIQELLQLMGNVDWLFASIGGINVGNDYRSATNHRTMNLLNEMKLSNEMLEGAVGDIAYSFFDKNGHGKAEWDLALTPGLDNIEELVESRNKKVVVIVGSYKIQALSALFRRRRLCNVLITDSLAAQELITSN